MILGSKIADRGDVARWMEFLGEYSGKKADGDSCECTRENITWVIHGWSTVNRGMQSVERRLDVVR